MRPNPVEVEDDLAAEEENKVINEEYKIWKKNAPYLYDVVITHALDWPSLTCQWFPDTESSPNKPYTTHRILLGTHTSGQAQDYVQIATVQIPKRTGTAGAEELTRASYSENTGELGGHTLPPAPRISVIQRINHRGEVNRARYMPQNPDMIATKSVTGEVFVFDRTKHSSDPDKSGAFKPDMTLVGQTKEGYGLAWSPLKPGHILGASEDMTVCLWDINSYTKANSTMEPTSVFKSHTGIVGDVDWHPGRDHFFASVGDDTRLMLWDVRAPPIAVKEIHAHDREILTVSFSPANEFLLVTGSADQTALLHDIRAPAKILHSFAVHRDEVLHVSWSPHNATIFASASSDRRVYIWDISQIGVEQGPDDQEDGPPELLFVHGGHTARPTDFCWAPGADEHWTATSTSEDNIVMVWQPTMRVWAGDEVRVEEKELEADVMEGVEGASGGRDGTKSGAGSGGAPSQRSQSMSLSTPASVSGANADDDDI